MIVKRILRKYGYPPDKQEKATQTVLEQAEVLSEEWAVAWTVRAASLYTAMHRSRCYGSSDRSVRSVPSVRRLERLRVGHAWTMTNTRTTI